jgi:hypothetical protein
MAFSSEVDSGSLEENASNQEPKSFGSDAVRTVIWPPTAIVAIWNDSNRLGKTGRLPLPAATDA